MWSSSVDPVHMERASKKSEISKYITKPMQLEEVKSFLTILKAPTFYCNILFL